MGTFNGIDLAKEIPQGVALIFTTAYAQYAVDGFEVNAVDFLCKPFSYARFEKAVNKATTLHELQELAARPVFSAEDSISLNIAYKKQNIQLGDITYIEAMDNYVRIHLTGHRILTAQTTMKNIQALLPNEKFIRVHKSYIVPVHRISAHANKQITLYDGTVIPIGRTYLATLKF